MFKYFWVEHSKKFQLWTCAIFLLYDVRNAYLVEYEKIVKKIGRPSDTLSSYV